MWGIWVLHVVSEVPNNQQLMSTTSIYRGGCGQKQFVCQCSCKSFGVFNIKAKNTSNSHRLPVVDTTSWKLTYNNLHN